MSTYDLVADLPLTIDDYSFELLSKTVSSGFERVSTVIHIRGAGEEGLGEDVTYDAEEHPLQQEHGREHPLAGQWTFDSFSEHLGTLDLFPAGAPNVAAFRNYRRWGYESAALDLALRQSGTLARRRSSAASSSRCASSSPAGWASRRRSSRSSAGSPATRTCASSSTPRRTGTTR